MKERVLFIDGLRILLACIVVNEHLVRAMFPQALQESLLFSNDLTLWENISYSPLSMLFNGGWAVTVFFVVSGYVLSHALSQQNNRGIVNLSAFLGLRYFRFAVPVTGSLLLIFVLSKFELLHAGELATLTNSKLAAQSSQISLIGVFSQGMISSIFQFDFRHNQVLWTITLEIIGTFIVACYYTLKLEIKHQLAGMVIAVAFLIVVLLLSIGNGIIAFPLGIIIFELQQRSWWRTIWERKTLQSVALIASIALCSYTVRGGVGNPYLLFDFSIHDTSSKYFINAIGATLLLIVLHNSKRSQALLSQPGFTKLGKRSFGLYLTHYIVISSVSAYLALSLSIPGSTGYLLIMTVSLVISLLVAELFYRLVEKPLLSLLAAAKRKVTGNKVCSAVATAP